MSGMLRSQRTPRSQTWQRGRMSRASCLISMRPSPPTDFAPLPSGFFADVNRRSFLTRSAYGLGGLALASLLGRTPARGEERWAGVIHPTHFPIRAKRIIHLCMAGGPSHLETFDYKPQLKELHGQPFPESFTKGQQLAQLQNTELKARGPFVEFKKHAQSGQGVSTLAPPLA